MRRPNQRLGSESSGFSVGAEAALRDAELVRNDVQVELVGIAGIPHPVPAPFARQPCTGYAHRRHGSVGLPEWNRSFVVPATFAPVDKFQRISLSTRWDVMRVPLESVQVSTRKRSGFRLKAIKFPLESDQVST